jgi:hypothetical protein
MKYSTDAVKRYIDERSWANLLDYGAERAKALGIKESDIDRLIAESRAATGIGPGGERRPNMTVKE